MDLIPTPEFPIEASPAPATEAAERLADFVRRHPRQMILTGAGVSTDSGIPDYRAAREWGKPMAALTLGRIRADDFLDLKLSAHIGEALAAALARL